MFANIALIINVALFGLLSAIGATALPGIAGIVLTVGWRWTPMLISSVSGRLKNSNPLDVLSAWL
ncbi:hypothetical protein [Antarctobacter sp.]|uniref:hypothetical protein n=1 Tax=Antarctobacter sp. TaxID=1872577 RepID=UPI003A92BB7E